MHSVLKFNQKAQPKSYIDMNTKLTKEAKNDFDKDYFKLINNSVFGKTMEKIKKHRDIKLATTDKEVIWHQKLIITQQNGFLKT